MIITYVSQKTGKYVYLNTGRELGKGAFGSVFTLLDNKQIETNLVCKYVDLDEDKIPRSIKLVGTLNEINVLKKLGLLEGYYRTGNKFYIVMKKVEGTQELKQEYSTFRVLRNLHRNGVAHMDPHVGNFLASGSKIEAIDFNFSREASCFNFLDMIRFFKTRSDDFISSCKLMIQYYLKDMLDYAREHKLYTLLQILMIGSLIAAAFTGISAFAISSLVIREFITSFIVAQLCKELNSIVIYYSLQLNAWVYTLSEEISFLRVAKHYNQSFWNKETKLKDYLLAKAVRFCMFFAERIGNVVHILLSSLLIYTLSIRNAYELAKGGANVFEALNNIKKMGLDLAFAKVTPDMFVRAASATYLNLEILKIFGDYTELYLKPEFWSKWEHDLFYEYNPLLFAQSAWTSARNKEFEWTKGWLGCKNADPESVPVEEYKKQLSTV